MVTWQDVSALLTLEIVIKIAIFFDMWSHQLFSSFSYNLINFFQNVKTDFFLHFFFVSCWWLVFLYINLYFSFDRNIFLLFSVCFLVFHSGCHTDYNNAKIIWIIINLWFGLIENRSQSPLPTSNCSLFLSHFCCLLYFIKV